MGEALKVLAVMMHRASQPALSHASRVNGQMNINVIAATAKGKRLFAPLLFEGNLNALIFNHYLKEQLLKQLEPGSLLIMDNASFHKTRKTRELIEESGHELLFLPPYSPDFNPIEKHFANLKKIRTYQPTDIY